MAAAEVHIQEETESERIERWRMEELLRAGYPISAAELLAMSTEVDLHQATGLLSRGCTAELAVRILL